MATFQKITIVGHLGADPQIKNFDNGGMIASMSIATTETWTDKQSGEKKSITEWHRCNANGKLAELVDKYCVKGDLILIEGKLRTRKWIDNNNIERYTTEININELKFISKASNGQNQGSAVDDYMNTSPPQEHDDLPF